MNEANITSTTVLEPISRFCAYFPDINECKDIPWFLLKSAKQFLGIKKRNHKLLDYDAMRAKVKKLVEKPDKDVTKLPRAEKETEMAKAAYEQLNDQLFNELPQLIDLRVPYLDPSFEALVKIQLRFCAEAYSRMAQVQQYLDADTREQYAQGHLDSRVEQVLQEIRELSISGTVWAVQFQKGLISRNVICMVLMVLHEYMTGVTWMKVRVLTGKRRHLTSILKEGVWESCIPLPDPIVKDWACII